MKEIKLKDGRLIWATPEDLARLQKDGLISEKAEKSQKENKMVSKPKENK